MVFKHHLSFDPAEAGGILAGLAETPAVFSLQGETGQPYLSYTPNLRRRLTRLLSPAPTQSRRLALVHLVRSIQWTQCASDFSAQLLLYRAANQAFGADARQRLHLRTPFFLRMGMRNRFPRVWITNSISLNAADDLFGPFPSRHAAERYAEQVLDLHLLRRCFQDLNPDPQFPGCIYSEIGKCLAPCYGGCSDSRYDQEVQAVHAFLRTRGISLIDRLTAERDRFSRELDFETAAATHARLTKVEAVAALAPELAGALAAQSGVLVQPSVLPDAVDLYLVKEGVMSGPATFSMLGMRLPNEQSGSTSLFAHPAALVPVPIGVPQPEGDREQSPEDRIKEILQELEAAHRQAANSELVDHQALLARWYFRPQSKREGELIQFADQLHGEFIKPLLRSCARVLRARINRQAGGAVNAPSNKKG